MPPPDPAQAPGPTPRPGPDPQTGPAPQPDLARTPHPTRTPRPGTATIVAAYAFWATMVGTTVPTPLYPLYQHDFGFSALMVTVIFAVYALGVVVGLLAFGRLSDEIGRRPVIAVALLLAALAAGLFLAADGLPWMLTARVLSGFSAALITGGATAALLDLAAPGRKARAQSLAIAANMGGLACGTLLSGLLAQWAGSPLRLPWLVTLGLTAVAAAGLVALPETVAAPAGFRLRPQALRVPAPIRPAFLRAALTAGSGFAVLGVLTAVTGLFLGRVLHFEDPALTGLVVFLAFACTALGQFAARVLPAGRALPVACAGLVLAAALIATALLAESLPALLAGAAANGLATGIAVGNGLGVINGGTPPQHRGEVVSTYFAILYAMLSVPVIGVGVLIQAAGLRTAGVTFSALVAALALAVAVSLLRGPRQGR